MQRPPGLVIVDAQNVTDVPKVLSEISERTPSAEVCVLDREGREGREWQVKVVTSPAALSDVIARRRSVARGVAVASDVELPEVRDAVQAGITTGEVYHNTIQKNWELWASHAISLLPFIAESHDLHQVSGLYSGKTALIIGPGPSLGDISDETLREWCDSTVSICLNSAVVRCQEAGARPMFALGIDAFHQAYPHRELLLEPDVVCAFGPHAHPDWPSSAAGPTLYVSQDIWMPATSLARSLRLPSIDSGGSVSTVAYELARWMGCSTICMVGVDCCLSSDMGYDSTGHKTSVREEMLSSAVSYEGVAVSSLHTLDLYRGYLSRRALTSQSISHLVTSPRQARIDGWEVGAPPLCDVTRAAGHLGPFSVIGERKVGAWVEEQGAAVARRSAILEEVNGGMESLLESLRALADDERDSGPTMATDAHPMTMREMEAAEDLSAIHVVLGAVRKNISRCYEIEGILRNYE